jgi:hypothetical protein
MRIGSNDNFLSIEVRSLDEKVAVWRVEAAASFSGGRFSATHDCVVCDSSADAIRQFTEFASLSRSAFELKISEGGWVRCERDARGCIRVCYRFGSWRGSAAMEGEVIVDGEFSNGFHRQFQSLLADRP